MVDCIRHRQCIEMRRRREKAHRNEIWNPNGVAIMFAHLFSIFLALLVTDAADNNDDLMQKTSFVACNRD